MKIMRCCGGVARMIMVLVLLLALLAMLQISASKIELGIKLLLDRNRHQATVMARQKAAIIQHSAKEFLADGTLHLIQSEADGNRLRIYDRHAKKLWEGAVAAVPYTYLQWSKAEGRRHHCISRRFLQGAQSITPEFSRELKITVGNDTNNRVIWRYAPSARVFCGYNFAGAGCGYIGANGYYQQREMVKSFGPFENFIYRNAGKPRRFDNSPYRWLPRVLPVLLWQTRHRLYEIDFAARRVKLLLDLPQERLLQIQVSDWNPEQADNSSAQIHCLAGFGKHYLLNGGKITELTLAAELAQTTIRASITAAGIFLYQQGQAQEHRRADRLFHRGNADLQRQWVALYRIAADGQAMPLNRLEWQSPHHPIALTTPYYSRLVSPALYDPIWSLCNHAYQSCWADRCQLLEIAVEVLDHARPRHSIGNWLISGLLLLVMLWHARPRRNGWGGLVWWGGLVLGGNLAGLLTYLALQHSSLITCPICNQPRGLEVIYCPHCRSVLPSPQVKRPLVIMPVGKDAVADERA